MMEDKFQMSCGNEAMVKRKDDGRRISEHEGTTTKRKQQPSFFFCFH